MAIVLAFAYFAAQGADTRTWSLLENTLQLALGTVVLAVPPGVAAAVLVHRTDVWGRRIGWSALIGLLFIPLYLQAAGWDAWFGRQAWFWPAQDSDARRMTAAICIHAAAAVPWIAVIVGAALREVPSELEESAYLDMSVIGVLLRVTLPLCRPGILLACWWVFVMTIGEMTVTDLYQVRTFAEEIYTTVQLMGSASAGTLSEAVAPGGTWMLASWALVSLLVVAWYAHYEFPSASRTQVRMSLGRGRIFASLLLATIVVAIVAIPLINLCTDAGMQTEGLRGTVRRNWSLRKFCEMLIQSPWRFRSEFGWTALISASAASLATLIAIPLAWFARRRSVRGLFVLAVTSIVAAIPGPVVGLAIIGLLNRGDSRFLIWLYDRTILAPALAGAVRAMPVAIVVTWWGLRTISDELIDLSRMDGLGFVARFRHVLWPSRRKVLLAAWFASFVIATGDLAATLLVTPPGLSTLSVRIFGLLHAGVDDQVAGICLVAVLFSAAIALVTSRLMRRS